MQQHEIEIGRRVSYAGDASNLPGDGVIVAVHKSQNTANVRYIGPVGDTFDVALFDGRLWPKLAAHRLGRFHLLDKVHGPRLIEVALQGVAARQAGDLVAQAQADQAYQEREAARVIDAAPLFFWNGLKDAKGSKLLRCWFSEYGNGSVSGRYPAGTICITARDYDHFSDKVRACFAVENNSDLMTDYHDSDRIRVIPSHPLYPQVKAAMEAGDARRAKRGAA